MFVFVIIKVLTRLGFLPGELELDISVVGRFEDFSKGSGAGGGAEGGQEKFRAHGERESLSTSQRGSGKPNFCNRALR